MSDARILITDDEELMRIVEAIRPDQVVAFDTETTGLDSRRDHLVGFSFALNEKEAYYVPVEHFYLGVPEQVSHEHAKQAIRKIFNAKVVGHNLKFCYKLS